MSPYLFSLVIKLTKRAQDEAPWRIVFANYVTIVDDNTNVLEDKLEH